MEFEGIFGGVGSCTGKGGRNTKFPIFAGRNPLGYGELQDDGVIGVCTRGVLIKGVLCVNGMFGPRGVEGVGGSGEVLGSGE